LSTRGAIIERQEVILPKLPDFLVHDSTDAVGVAVVEGIKKGQTLTGWVMDKNNTIRVKCMDVIPLGHKLALKALKDGDTVLKYGHDIGRMVTNVAKGGHVHTHNLKTKRW